MKDIKSEALRAAEDARRIAFGLQACNLLVLHCILQGFECALRGTSDMNFFLCSCKLPDHASCFQSLLLVGGFFFLVVN